MEAALRTVVSIAGPAQTSSMERLEFKEVRGMEGIREASISIPANPDGVLHNKKKLVLRVAVANGNYQRAFIENTREPYLTS